MKKTLLDLKSIVLKIFKSPLTVVNVWRTTNALKSKPTEIALNNYMDALTGAVPQIGDLVVYDKPDAFILGKIIDNIAAGSYSRYYADIITLFSKIPGFFNIQVLEPVVSGTNDVNIEFTVPSNLDKGVFLLRHTGIGQVAQNVSIKGGYSYLVATFRGVAAMNTAFTPTANYYGHSGASSLALGTLGSTTVTLRFLVGLAVLV